MELSTEYGSGTSIVMTIPLQSAVISVLLVKVGTEVYALPSAVVVETRMLSADMTEVVDDSPILHIEGEDIEPIRLREFFRLSPDCEGAETHAVIAEGGERQIGIFVDSVVGEREVVFKRLKERYVQTPGISGGTILPDGRVALTIDVNGLSKIAGTKTGASSTDVIRAVL